MSNEHPDDRSPDPPQPDVARQVADDPSLFSSAAMQFYRGEIDRMTTWRARLDQTTNWAVVVMAAILTWAFSSSDNPHYVLLIGVLAVTAFLFIEAQRYQEYDAWRARVLLLQQDLFAGVYRPVGPEHDDWRDRLSRDLRQPTLRLPLWKAVGHRLQRVYFPLLTVLLAAWGLRITVFESSEAWYRTAAIAGVPGPAIVTAIAAWYLLLAGLTLWSLGQATKLEFDDETAPGILDAKR